MERLIFVSGMAHSGTTILTHLLRQHPSLFHQTDGYCKMFHESEIFLDKNNLIEIMNMHNDKNILIKKPWIFSEKFDFLTKEFKSSFFVCCMKSFDEITKSWSRITSQVKPQMKSHKSVQKEVYDSYVEKIKLFEKHVDNFHIINYSEFLFDTKKIMDNLTEFLKINKFDYDLSMVGSNKNIKVIINQ